MALNDSPVVCLCVWPAPWASSHNVPSSEMITQVSPDLFLRHFYSQFLFPRGSIHVAHSIARDISFNMVIVALHFSKSLLQNHRPEWVVVAQTCCKRLIIEGRNIVIYDGGLRDSKSKQVDCIASQHVQISLKDLFHGALVALGDSCSSRNKPAITNRSLFTIVRADPLSSIEWRLLELWILWQALKKDFSSNILVSEHWAWWWFINALPKQSVQVMREGRVCPWLLALGCFVWLHLGHVVSADFRSVRCHFARFVLSVNFHFCEEVGVNARRCIQLHSLDARGQTWDEKSFFHDLENPCSNFFYYQFRNHPSSSKMLHVRIWDARQTDNQILITCLLWWENHINLDR